MTTREEAEREAEQGVLARLDWLVRCHMSDALAAANLPEEARSIRELPALKMNAGSDVWITISDALSEAHEAALRELRERDAEFQAAHYIYNAVSDSDSINFNQLHKLGWQCDEDGSWPDYLKFLDEIQQRMCSVYHLIALNASDPNDEHGGYHKMVDELNKLDRRIDG